MAKTEQEPLPIEDQVESDATPVDDAPVTPTPPVEDAPVEDPQPDPAEAFSLLSTAQTRGLDTSAFQSDAALAEAMFSTLDNSQRNDALAKIGQQFAPYADRLSDFQKWESEQAAPAVEPEPEPASFAWDAPEYDERWAAMPLEQDDHGYYKAPVDMPSMIPIAEKMNAYREHQTKTLTAFARNPQPLIQSAIADEIASLEKRVTESNTKAIEAAMHKQAEAAEAQAYIDNHEGLFQVDDNSQPVYDTNGNQMMTPKGAKMAEYADMLANAGVTDQSALRTMLDKLIAADEATAHVATPGPPVAPPVAPQVTPPVKPRRFIDKVANRSGTIPTNNSSQQQNPHASLEEIAKRVMQEQGVNPR